MEAFNMSFKIVFGGVFILATCSATAYYWGKHATEPKIVEKTVYQEKIVEVENQDKKLYEAIISSDDKRYIRIINDLGVSKSTPAEYAILIDNAKWLAVLMYRECGICTPQEKTFIGVSAIEFMRTRQYGANMKSLVYYRNNQTGKKFVSFTQYDIPTEKDKFDYFALSVALLERTSDVEAYWADYEQAKRYLRVKNNDGIYWCNRTIASCPWHESMIAKGQFKKFRYDVRSEGTRISPIFEENLSKHTFYVNRG